MKKTIALLFIVFSRIVESSLVSGDAGSLLAFKDGITSDPSGLMSTTWDSNRVDSTGCPSHWYGVTCWNGFVNRLSLDNLLLEGSIRSGTLGSLSRLSTLTLSNNTLAGGLPPDLGNLASLLVLDLSENAFTGGLPPALGGCRLLRNVSLAGNAFTGPVPDMLGNMSSLVGLDVSRNRLTGGIPPSVASLSGLLSLNISGNGLSGVVPREFRNLGSLRALDLHENRLSGEVDPGMMSLSSLQYIDLSRNEFSGRLPWQQGAPFVFPQRISYVNLGTNRFSGELAPEDSAGLFVTNLQVLDVSSNLLSGKLPSFGFVFSLRVLRLQNNSFTGFVPPALLAADSVVHELDISMNNLSGSVGMISATSVQILRLSSNNLSGPLPIRLGSCSVVDFSNNNFSGDLSVMKSWGDSLQVLDLARNSLTGILPNETTNLLRLMQLNLSHNSISGKIPRFYASFRKLISLDLSSNALDGEIPGEFFHSGSLTLLRLSGNRLTGTIPVVSPVSPSSIPGQLLSPSSTSSSSPLLFSPLQVLDLSSNNLSGSIPHEIGSLYALQSLDLSRNAFTGSIPTQLTLLKYLELLDLSFNRLTGHIPPHLPSTLTTLNLSNNQLSGTIPADLSRFPQTAFFPGNLGLQQAPGNAVPGAIPHRSRNKTGLSSALKAGLIGGSIALFTVLLLSVALFVYYRRSHQRRDEDGVEKGEHRPEFVVVAQPSMSREQLLTGEQRATHEGLGLKKKNGGSPSKRRTKSRTSLLEEGPSSLEQSPSLKVRSPDKLAGDLVLFDNSVTFTPEELSSAPAEVLGRSSHGTSYKATLDNGHVLTVKWLREGLAKNKKSFMREAREFGSVQHPNIVPVRGYYWGPREHEKLLISDFIANGSLADRLSERSGRRYPPFDWPQRLRIANDIARGLSYLHTKHKMPHGNLKATNVLIGGPALVARLSDYSVHRLMTQEGTANQILNAGALGYRAPELANAKKPKPTLKADVYAFGVILLEIITGKGAGDIISGNSGAVDLTDWVKLLVSEGRGSECYDRDLVGYEGERESPRGADGVLGLALRCISERGERPSIRAVQEELSGD